MQKNSKEQIRPLPVCSKSVAKTLYRNKFLISECFFWLACHWELKVIRNLLYVRGIAEQIFEQIVTVACFKKQTPEVFCKKSAFKNFATFTGKYLCWSNFLIKLEGLKISKKDTPYVISQRNLWKFWKAPILKNICEPLLLYLQVILFKMHEKDQLAIRN